MARKLKRSKGAIIQKASKIGLGPYLEAGEYITLNQLYVALKGPNHGSDTLKQWIEKGLPVRKKKVRSCYFKVIYFDDWWDWAEMNRTIIDFSKLEPGMLGKEPEWVKEQRRADVEKRQQYKKTPWTRDEDLLLIQLLESYKYTYRELSLRPQRTEGAIKRRMIDLNIKARPLKMPNHTPWTKSEEDRLKELYHQGHQPDTIANYIDRSAQAIRGKIERLIKEGLLFPRNEFRVSC